MNKIRTMIVDDESLAREGIALRLKKYADIEIIAECKNGREALQVAQELEPDLMFLDIQMPGLDGFEVVAQLQGDNMPLVVFVTAFDKYAIDAFEVHAIDYVLKPVEEKRLQTAIERVRIHRQQSDADNQKKRLIDLISNITGQSAIQVNQMVEDDEIDTPAYPEKIAIKDSGVTTLLPIVDITWIEAAGDYMCIHSGSKVHVMRSTMKQLEAKLNPTIFQRIHRSTIVNLDYIEKICSHINGEYFLILKDGSRIKMSRSYRDKIKHIV